ncbi:unnamed protein product [Paramecium sonneborni]|uniref:Uncharacterized protein n=1 Tax=Paramecium sonneborni TaxID=65129 RepID=A0A8S1RVB9_9CILI|nr:unnamed protein product [Paramecium sonneborni]
MNSRNNKYSFKQGGDIYFSYFQNKRIFGGPFVWVNAQFNFHLALENIQQIVYVKFEIILGDEQMSRIKFHYTINQQSKKTSTINNNLNLKEDQNWKNDYKTQIISVREKIEYSTNDNHELNILFDCDNNFYQANSTFCGIKNMFISVQKPILDEIDLLEQYQNDNEYIDGLEELFVISKCGDGLKSIDEDCDDGNLMPLDGCFNCKYSCEQQCQVCVKVQCLLCIDGYYLNLEFNQCEIICGDLIIQGQEQYDDGVICLYLIITIILTIMMVVQIVN